MKSKYCARCGRVMTSRKQWADNWEQVKYCSKACRTHRIRAVDRALESAMVELLGQRSPQNSICPSEAAHSSAPSLCWVYLWRSTISMTERSTSRNRLPSASHALLNSFFARSTCSSRAKAQKHHMIW